MKNVYLVWFNDKDFYGIVFWMNRNRVYTEQK